MKKLMLASLVVVLLSLMVAVPVLAKTNVIKGEVTAVNADGTLTIQTKKDGTLTVVVPEGFDLASVAVGSTVIVKGAPGSDGRFMAESIKVIGTGTDDDDDEDEAEGSKDNSAFCSPDKQDKPHPFAAKLAERYNVTTEWVMGYFCDGYGMGAIMLALKTAELTGADPEDLLAQRAEGMGWGQIWQEMKLIGSEKEAKTPPGWLKKGDHGKPKP